MKKLILLISLMTSPLMAALPGGDIASGPMVCVQDAEREGGFKCNQIPADVASTLINSVESGAPTLQLSAVPCRDIVDPSDRDGMRECCRQNPLGCR